MHCLTTVLHILQTALLFDRFLLVIRKTPFAHGHSVGNNPLNWTVCWQKCSIAGKAVS